MAEFWKQDDIQVITPQDINDLRGLLENQRLEFKKLYPLNDHGRSEIAKDICAFANAEGGYIVIGASEKDGRYDGTPGVDTPEMLGKRIREINREWLEGVIPNIETRVLNVNGKLVLVVYVPPSSNKPHRVKRVVGENGGAFLTKPYLFYKREETDNREMTYEELRSAFVESSGGYALADMQRKLDYLYGHSMVNSVEGMARAVEKDPGSLNSITTGLEVLSTLERRHDEGKDKKIFWLSITPENAGTVAFDLQDKALNSILLNSPGSRRNGWSMITVEPYKMDSAGLYHNDFFKDIRLHRNGTLEFNCSYDSGMFCWGQEEEAIKKAPSLYPYAVVELPVSFLRLAREIYNHIKVEGSFYYAAEYLNLRGAILKPYAPNAFGFLIPLGGITPYKNQNFKYGPKKLENRFAPDQCAFDSVKYFYESFGYSRQQIPFFDDMGNCSLR